MARQGGPLRCWALPLEAAGEAALAAAKAASSCLRMLALMPLGSCLLTAAVPTLACACTQGAKMFLTLDNSNDGCPPEA